MSEALLKQTPPEVPFLSLSSPCLVPFTSHGISISPALGLTPVCFQLVEFLTTDRVRSWIWVGEGAGPGSAGQPCSGRGRESTGRCQLSPRLSLPLPQHPPQAFTRLSGLRGGLLHGWGMLNCKSGSVTWSWTLPDIPSITFFFFFLAAFGASLLLTGFL